MIYDIHRTIENIVVSGGEIVEPVGTQAPEITAKFRDPAGNVFGLYQHSSAADD